MFCGNCGANNPEGSSVCGSCGAALTPEETSGGTGSKLPMDKNKLIGLAAIVAGAIVAIALLIFIITRFVGGGGPKGVAVDYVKACGRANGGKTIISLVPNEVVNEVLEQSDDFDSKAELTTELNDVLEDVKDSMEDYYGKYKIKVEVRKVNDWKNSEIKDYNDRLDDAKIDMEIQDGADVELKVTVNGKDDKSSNKPTIKVIKVGGKWYIDQRWYDVDFEDFSVYGLLENF